MRQFGTSARKRCPYCKALRPSYLIESHKELCAREQNRRQAIRQQELLEELKRLQQEDGA